MAFGKFGQNRTPQSLPQAASVPQQSAPANPLAAAAPAPGRFAQAMAGRRSFTGLSGVSASRMRAYPQSGHYLYLIRKITQGTGAQKKKDFTAVDLCCLHAFPDGEPFILPGSNVAQPFTAPGAPCSYSMVDNGQYDYHLRDWKKLLLELLLATEADIAEAASQLLIAATDAQRGQPLPKEFAEMKDYVPFIRTQQEAEEAILQEATIQAVGEGQPYAGTVIEVRSVNSLKKKARDAVAQGVQAKSDDYITKTSVIRRVSLKETVETLTPQGLEVLRRELPDLDARIVAEQAQ